MSTQPNRTRTLLVAAGGTGGHIMPGLAVAHEMRRRGWQVRWVGDPARMEGRLVPEQGYELLPLSFGGVRGKGLMPWLRLPWTLSCAVRRLWGVFSAQRPSVVLGMGGYAAFPAGVVARLRRVPLVVHEQNAVAGTANRWLARGATTVLAGFPGALPQALVVGNPVRETFLGSTPPAQRYAARQGPLRLLVLGGSLGAAVLNERLPQALALLPLDERPEVVHQSGQAHLTGLQAAYRQAGVQARCIDFIEDVADEMARADLVICRAGAMTVAEVAAAGVAALFIPLPHAIDDHQRANADYLSGCGAAWMQPQAELSAEWLAEWLAARTRDELAGVAAHAHIHARQQAAAAVADACEAAARRAGERS